MGTPFEAERVKVSSLASRKKKWNVRFVAEHLALLLVLRRQVEKEKEARVEPSCRRQQAATAKLPPPR